MLSMETLVSLPAYVHEHDLHIRPYSLRRGYLYGTNTPAVVRERGVLCRRAIIHVELRTRRVARHGDRRRNDRGALRQPEHERKPYFSPRRCRVHTRVHAARRHRKSWRLFTWYVHDIDVRRKPGDRAVPRDINNVRVRKEKSMKNQVNVIERISQGRKAA